VIKEMLKVQIIGPRALLDEAVRELHTAAVVHLETMPEEYIKESDFLSKLPIERDKLKEKETLEKYSERLRNFRALLPQPSSYRLERAAPDDIKRLMAELEPFEERAKALRARKDELTEELSVINKYEKLLRGFAPIVSRLGGLKNFDITGLTLEKSREDISGLLEAEVSRVTEGMFSIHVKDIDEHTLGVVLTYPKGYGAQVRALLSGKAISEMRLPDEYSEMTLMEALKQMGRRKAELPGLIDGPDRELYSISTRWYPLITGVARVIEDVLEEIGVLSYAAATKFAFIIEGWVPAEVYGDLNGRLTRIFGGKINIRTLEVAEREREAIPVYIKNPRLIRPFEVFLAALSPPKYGSTDPTPFVALFFPAFFGLIVADMGYGAMILVFAAYIRKRLTGKGKRFFRDLASVFIVSAASAMFFGFLFGEFFGDLAERAGLLHPILFNRIEALKTLIVVALAIGIGHVLLGIIIGIVSHARRRDLKETGAKAVYLVLIVSFLSLIGVMFGLLPKAFIPWSAGVMAASFVALVVLEGMLGPIEFIEALGNIVSYVRIMAVGTASVVMALVANRMGQMADNVVLGVIIAALIHGLNLMLSVLSPSIQSMRLQYVEFFSKFYEGGGRLYRPFKKK
jgi:V/A-type H+-transporting ATPase subunit I